MSLAPSQNFSLILVKTLLLFLSLPSTALWALEPLVTQDWKHSLPEGSFKPGYTPLLLEKGYFVGVTEEFKTTYLSYALTEEILTKNWQLRSSQNASIKKAVKKIVDEIKAGSGSPHIPVEKSEVTPKESEPVGGVFNWSEFRRCAVEMLPLLKELRRIERTSIPPDLEMQMAIEATKNITRDALNKAKKVNMNGVPIQSGLTCGKFLGLAEFTVLSVTDEIKILTTITSRDGKESQLLLQIAVAAFHNDSPPQVAFLWTVLWKEISLRAVFSKNILPDMRVLAELIKNDMYAQGVSREALLIRDNFDQLVKKGIDFSEGYIKL